MDEDWYTLAFIGNHLFFCLPDGEEAEAKVRQHTTWARMYAPDAAELEVQRKLSLTNDPNGRWDWCAFNSDHYARIPAVGQGDTYIYDDAEIARGLFCAASGHYFKYAMHPDDWLDQRDSDQSPVGTDSDAADDAWEDYEDWLEELGIVDPVTGAVHDARMDHLHFSDARLPNRSQVGRYWFGEIIIDGRRDSVVIYDQSRDTDVEEEIRLFHVKRGELVTYRRVLIAYRLFRVVDPDEYGLRDYALSEYRRLVDGSMH